MPNEVPENVHFANQDGIRREALTEEDVLENTLALLGAPVVKVELRPAQFSVIMKRVLDEYNKWLPVYKLGVISGVSSSIQEYDFLELDAPYGRKVVDVAVVSKNQFFAPVSGVFALGIPHPISHLAPDQFDIALRYIGAAKKIYSSELDWEWQEPKLFLHAPASYGGPFDLAYQYLTTANEPNDVTEEDWGWFKDYHLALSKIVLGNIRGKFKSIPGPAGQDIRGSELIDEGKEEKKQLEEDIRSKSAARVPPLFLNSKS